MPWTGLSAKATMTSPASMPASDAGLPGSTDTTWMPETTAARPDGVSEGRIIFRHMLPSFASHIIASISLAIPAMILAETSLSFLGLGLQPPTISWGVLLREAQNIRSIATAPWLFAPGAAVVVAVIALNFLGDGLRDASDPYNK